MKPTLVELQSARGDDKVPFAMSGPPNLTNTGNIHKTNNKNIILEILIGWACFCYEYLDRGKVLNWATFNPIFQAFHG